MKKRNEQIIGIFGFGNMGRAIFNVLQKENAKGLKFYIHSIDLKKCPGATCLHTPEELFTHCDIVFICVKPQDFYNLSLKSEKAISKKSPLIISIMAGVTLKNIRKIIPSKKIVRAMPNIALQIQESVIGWHTKEKNLSKNELKNIRKIFSIFGAEIFLKNENMLNSITAISGSGPAYVFLFTDALIQAAKNLGFSKKEAEIIVFKTTIGSLKYAQSVSNIPLDKLIKKVTSKKGTTEAALKNINTTLFYKKWQSATRKAYARAKELSKYEIK